MLNKVWFALLLIGIVYGFTRAAFQDPARIVGSDTPKPSTTSEVKASGASRPATRSAALTEMGKNLTGAGIDAAKTSVEICLSLIGIMALWLGFMKVAEDAGLITWLASLLRPLFRWLFPEIPKDHPAAGAIMMNLAANILGLDNAATPLGLKAMKELQTLNPVKDTATNSMVMFLAINTSSITLLPFTLIGYRSAMGSKDPAAPVVAILLATTCSTIMGIASCRALQRFYPVRPSSGPDGPANSCTRPPDSPGGAHGPDSPVSQGDDLHASHTATAAGAPFLPQPTLSRAKDVT